jgi:SSS family solute:Na+ symporter
LSKGVKNEKIKTNKVKNKNDTKSLFCLRKNMTITILIAYLLVLIWVAMRSFPKIKNHQDFFVARKQGTTPLITGSLLATILGGSAVVGTINMGPKMGWATAWFMLSAVIGLLLLLPLIDKVFAKGKYTLPGLLSDMFGDKLQNISGYIISIAWLGIVAAQIIASAKILESFAGLDYVWGAIISGLVFIFYTIVGGQISILKTDLMQAVLIILGLILVGVFTFFKLPLDSLQTINLNFPFNQNFHILDFVVLFFTYALTYTAGPDIYSRIFSAGSAQVARRSVRNVALILIPVAFLIAFLSVVGASNSNLFGSSGSLIVNISQFVLPGWAVAIIALSLISVVLSSADTTLLSASVILTELLEKKKMGEKTVAKTRLIILVLGILSMIIALLYSSVIGVFLIALSVYAGAFITPLLLGLVGFRFREKNVWWACVVGGFVALIGKIIFNYQGNQLLGNLIIIGAFLVNALILFLGYEKYKK